MPRNTNTTMPRRSNIFYAVLTDSGELQSYVFNPESVLDGKPALTRVCRYTYEMLHNAGYFIDVERRIASMNLAQLAKFCRKIEPGARFNGNRICKSRKLTHEEKQETIQDEEEQRARAEEYFEGRGRTNGNTLAEHLDHLIPNSRK